VGKELAPPALVRRRGNALGRQARSNLIGNRRVDRPCGWERTDQHDQPDAGDEGRRAEHAAPSLPEGQASAVR